MSMRRFMAGAAGGLVMALGAGHINTLQAQEAAAAFKSADQQFVSRLAADNLLEVRLGQTAEKTALSPAVKQFAQQMVTDHTAMQQQWMAIAERNDLEFKVEWTPEHKQEAERLRTLTGAEFDRAYMGLMVQNHSAKVREFDNERRVAHSTEIRDRIVQDLGTLQNHLRLAQQVGSQVGADVSGGVATTPTVPQRTDTTIITQTPPRVDTTFRPTPTPPTAQRPGEGRRTNQERAEDGNVRADAQFIRNVEAHHYLQIRLGRLAQEKGRDPAVKRFGDRMEEDHGEFEEQWINMASRNGMKLQPGMGPDNRANLVRLEKFSGARFDREYMTFIIQSHNGYLNYWRKEGRGARTAPVRQLVNRGLPTLEEHMEEARQIANRIGVDVDAALAGRRVASERTESPTVID